MTATLTANDNLRLTETRPETYTTARPVPAAAGSSPASAG